MRVLADRGRGMTLVMPYASDAWRQSGRTSGFRFRGQLLQSGQVMPEIPPRVGGCEARAMSSGIRIVNDTTGAVLANLTELRGSGWTLMGWAAAIPPPGARVTGRLRLPMTMALAHGDHPGQ